MGALENELLSRSHRDSGFELEAEECRLGVQHCSSSRGAERS
jgi:hypothetical protein